MKNKPLSEALPKKEGDQGEQAKQEQAAQEQALQERSAQEQPLQERSAQEQTVQEQTTRERAAQEQAKQEQTTHERAAQEKPLQERSAQEQAEATNNNCETSEAKSGKKKKSKPKLTEKQKTLRAVRRLITKILVLAIIATVLLVYVGGIHVSHDVNMFPAVGDGDLAITYKLGGYYNGDIVIYEVDGINRFGRVVGIPGDTISIGEDGYYTINGVAPYETIYFQTRPAEQSNITYPYTVKEGEVFILNDLRDNANDSRLFGGVSEVKGRVVLLIRRRGF